MLQKYNMLAASGGRAVKTAFKCCTPDNVVYSKPSPSWCLKRSGHGCKKSTFLSSEAWRCKIIYYFIWKILLRKIYNLTITITINVPLKQFGFLCEETAGGLLDNQFSSCFRVGSQLKVAGHRQTDCQPRMWGRVTLEECSSGCMCVTTLGCARPVQHFSSCRNISFVRR